MTTPQMDWLDDERRKRAVSSDDIVDDPNPRPQCDHICLQVEGHDGPHFYGYRLPSPVWDIERLQAAIERLRRWKAEAITVIEDWEAVWEAAGNPGVLGQSKSCGLLGELGRLDDEIKRLREIAEAAEQYHDVACNPDWCRLCRALNAWLEARREQ